MPAVKKPTIKRKPKTKASSDGIAPTVKVSDEPKKEKRASPVEFTDELALAICKHIAVGKSLRSYCAKPGTPALGSIYRWLADNETFRDQYARAREDQADSYADEIIDIADNEDDPQKARVRIDARKWIASKLKPKKYGDKLGISGDGDGAPIQHQHGVQWMTEEQAKARGWA